MSESDEQKGADELRALAHKTVSQDRKKWFEESGAIEGSFKDYCSRMKEAHFFGGEVELLALSGAMQLPITVYMPHQLGGYRAIAEYGQEYNMRGRPVGLLYNGHNHYDCLVP
jgi:hypothetical protein